MHVQKFKPRKITCRDYSKYNKELYKNDLRQVPWQHVINETSLNKAWTLFKNYLSDVIHKHAPLKEKLVRGKECPWMTVEIKQQMKNQDYHLTKARRTKEERDWEHIS